MSKKKKDEAKKSNSKKTKQVKVRTIDALFRKLDEAPVEFDLMEDTPSFKNKTPLPSLVEQTQGTKVLLQSTAINNTQVAITHVNNTQVDKTRVMNTHYRETHVNDTRVNEAEVNKSHVIPTQVLDTHVSNGLHIKDTDTCKENLISDNASSLWGNDTSVLKTHVSETRVHKAPVDDTLVKKTWVNNTHVDETYVTKARVMDAHVKDTRVAISRVNDAHVGIGRGEENIESNNNSNNFMHASESLISNISITEHQDTPIEDTVDARAKRTHVSGWSASPAEVMETSKDETQVENSRVLKTRVFETRVNNIRVIEDLAENENVKHSHVMGGVRNNKQQQHSISKYSTSNRNTRRSQQMEEAPAVPRNFYRNGKEDISLLKLNSHSISVDSYVFDYLVKELKNPICVIIYLYIWRRTIGEKIPYERLSHQLIADETGVARKTVLTNVRILQSLNLLEIKSDGDGMTCTYRILKPWDKN